MAKSEVEKVMGHDIGPFSGIQAGMYIDRNLSVFGDAGQTAMIGAFLTAIVPSNWENSGCDWSRSKPA